MSRLLYDIWLSLAIGPGSTAYGKLFEYFSSSYDVYRADSEELAAVGLTARQNARLSEKSIAGAARVMDACTAQGIGVVVLGDAAYPKRLAAIPNPPFLLYVSGQLPALDESPAAAVVGTRSMSEYGMRMAYKIAYELTAAGVTVVSGLARGIDACAACGALDAGGPTVAVLGSGPDVPYPAEHAALLAQIARNGAVISEYPLGTRPEGRNFPMRNRIISGLSCGTLVVEGNRHSGAMLTAGEAMKQGRAIFALPGNVEDENSEGTNELIRTGAKMVRSAADILPEFSMLFGDRLDRAAFSRAERNSDLRPGALEARGVRVPSAANAQVPPQREASPAPPAEKRGAEGPEETRRAKKSPFRPERKTAEAAPAPGRQSGPAPLPDGKMKLVYDAMTPGKPECADSIRIPGLDAGEIVGLLSMLEVMGYVESRPGGFYVRGA